MIKQRDKKYKKRDMKDKLKRKKGDDGKKNNKRKYMLKR
jgi:hypothetical protein